MTFYQVLHSGFQSYHVDWTNSGELLAVAGKIREIAVKSNHTIRYVNVLHFYNDTGQLVYKAKIPCETVRFLPFHVNTDLGSLYGKTQCGNFRIFLPLRFYVKSILVILKPPKTVI